MQKRLLFSALLCLFCFPGFSSTITPGSTAICIGGTVTEHVVAVTYGTWSSGNPAVATVGYVSGLVTGISPGTAVISYNGGKNSFTCVVTVNACCLSSALIINTGYNPATDSAIAGQADDNVIPVHDPKWIVTAISADALAQIALFGSTPVTFGTSADVVDANITPYPTGAWAVNTTTSPSSWITAQNAHGYQTDYLNDLTLTMTLSRPFAMCKEDSVRIDAMIANDNYIASANIDDTINLPDFAIQAAPGADPNDSVNHREFQHFLTANAIYLAPGPHMLNIVVQNYNYPESTIYNPTGMNLYGRLYSVTGAYTLVSETDTACSLTGCGANAHNTTTAVAHTVLPSRLVCFPNPGNGSFTLSGTMPGTTGEVKIEVVDMMGKVVYTDVAPIADGGITKTISLDGSVPGGVYLLRVVGDNVGKVIRVVVER